MFREFVRQCTQVFCVLMVVCSVVSSANAEPLPRLDARTIVDSEEPFDRRVYSYEMGIDSNGNVHIVYLKPTTGNSAQLIYVSRVSGIWSDQVLSSSGLRGSISTNLIVDSTNVVHLCYIKTDDHLYYQTITDNVPAVEIKVQAGGWHTRMQLDENNRALFVRGRNGSVRKLDLLTTVDSSSWSQRYWNLPSLSQSLRIGGFVYADGVYHVTYGDSAITKPVVTGGNVTFHNLHYVSSLDGENWNESVVDDSGTLYELEFWTSLILDNGTPVVSWYKYAEYGGQYNTGTSTWLAKWNGSSWQEKNVTQATYPATREGMGVGLVRNGAGDYFGGWDCSPDNTYDDDFRGARGNIALVRSGSDWAWNNKWQVDEFSAEGEVKLRIKNNRLYYLALGDYIDAKLYFREYDMNLFSSPDVTPPPLSEKVVAPVVQLLLKE